ncbi:hypothetical protein SAMN05880592_101317 [Bosea sp. TND4EK4]|nr:hypothetical protein SAMN05880592_101317 [Bosea sp. TND4EK4]
MVGLAIAAVGVVLLLIGGWPIVSALFEKSPVASDAVVHAMVQQSWVLDFFHTLTSLGPIFWLGCILASAGTWMALHPDKSH